MFYVKGVELFCKEHKGMNASIRERIVQSLFRLRGQSIRSLKEHPRKTGHERGRRLFLKWALLAAAPFVAPPGVSLAQLHDPISSERSLSFYNPHTGESLKTLYWAEGAYLSDALAEINHILRDHRTDEMKPIDARLLDLLYTIHRKLRTRQPFHIISGYRCPSTNALLRAKSRMVAKNSLHLYGKAADVRLPHSDLSALRRVAISLRGGGVGYYPKSQFVHVDVGKVRYW
jgi:uncharacterized protein YcbK (DUF882 family)